MNQRVDLLFGQTGMHLIYLSRLFYGDVLVVQENGPLTEEQTLFVTKEVLSLLNACQMSGVLHGDIKPENFVIESSESRALLQHQPKKLKPGWLKAIDFGTSTQVGRLTIANCFCIL